jgi:hypothetical protein
MAACFIQNHEAVIRLSALFGIFAAMALWEWRVPQRTLTLSRARRWSSNLALLVALAFLPRLAAHLRRSPSTQAE